MDHFSESKLGGVDLNCWLGCSCSEDEHPQLLFLTTVIVVPDLPYEI